MEKRTVTNGGAVQYVDEYGVEHDALVTQCWGANGSGEYDPADARLAINIAYVSKDERARDQWGQQMVHDSSVVHRSNQSAPGRFWFQK